jgi:hypothetical protein
LEDPRPLPVVPVVPVGTDADELLGALVRCDAAIPQTLQ